MPEIIEAIVLGIVQGLTEFLPVSSSGHLEIAKYLFGNNAVAKQSLTTTIVLHFATALATIIVFRKDVLEILYKLFTKGWNPQKKFSLFVIISMIPAAIIGLFFDHMIEQFFDGNIVFVAFMLIITGILLFISERIPVNNKSLSPISALTIGISQAFALLPGISRSGATISTALLLGIEKEKAARFSFLMVVPLIFGKMLSDVLTGDFTANAPDMMYLVGGFIAAFVAGYAACTWMLQIVKRSKLKWFAFYCFGVAATILILTSFT